MSTKNINQIDRQVARDFIARIIVEYLSDYPSDTKFFIDAVTLGIQQYADAQQDHAGRYLNFLTDILLKNPNVVNGDIYDVGMIVATILPSWQGAGCHKTLKELYADRLTNARPWGAKNTAEEYSNGAVEHPAPTKPMAN
jgi:hypothetical protein